MAAPRITTHNRSLQVYVVYTSVHTAQTVAIEASLHEPVNIASALRVLSLIAAHGATKMKQLRPPVSCGIWEREHYSCSVMVSADVSEMGKTRVVFVDMVVKWTVHILLQPCSRSKPTTRHQSQM